VHIKGTHTHTRHTGITEKHTHAPKNTRHRITPALSYIHNGFLGKAEDSSRNNDIIPWPNAIFPLPMQSVKQLHVQCANYLAIQ